MATNFTPTKAATKRNRLTQNCHAFSVGVEKLSRVHNNKVAAASKPTTAGRNPMNTDCTVGVCMYFMNILLMSTIRISDGSTKAMVEMKDPSTAMGME